MVVSLALTGCASNELYQQWQPDLAARDSIAELSAIPFYPQKSMQCGPAALATALSSAGEPVQPDDLTEQLFIRGREGSLQLEMLATTRRHGYVPYVHRGGLDELLQQLEQGIPVVVLQNLGFSWAPTWHYAVVVGFDGETDEFLLRSGRQRLRRTGAREFARTWAYSERWMMTVLKPGLIPQSATALAYIDAASGLERVQQYDAALASYSAAAARWPHDPVVLMALGNAHYTGKRYQLAEQSYRKALAADPQLAAAAHNLAWALMRQSKAEQALPYAQMAARLSDKAQYHGALQALTEPGT